MDSYKDLLLSLLNCNVFQVGNFKLKSGNFSPVYIDLRKIISFPAVVQNLAKAIRTKQNEINLSTDLVCGVPYTALPIASVFSILYDLPMIMKRKEKKDYGTKRLIEGKFTPGNTCLIIEDIVSTGTSVIETVEALRNEGLVVTDCIVVVNRNQGGLENLKKIGIHLHQLYDINDIFSCYCSVNNVDENLKQEVLTYFKNTSQLPVHRGEFLALPFSHRADVCSQPVGKRLFKIMEQKKTNLCIAVDATSSQELLKLADELGPHICMLKTHIDILNDFSSDVLVNLSKISKTHNFLIFEDRKFADIGNTVMNQYKNGIYKIQEWADIVTVHGIPGEGIIEALKASVNGEARACVLVAEMSSKAALTNADYKDSVVKIAKSHSDFVIGFITQTRCTDSSDFIHMSPGVNIFSSGDTLGQQYKSPEEAVLNGADIIIVGRGICKAENAVVSAIEYKNRGYNAYISQLSK